MRLQLFDLYKQYFTGTVFEGRVTAIGRVGKLAVLLPKLLAH